MILIFLLHALFGMSFPISKILLTYTTPVFLTAVRMIIAGSILLAYQYIYAHHHFHFHRKHLWSYIQIIFFGVYITYILRFWGLAHLTAAKTAFLFNIAPFFTAFYSYVMFKETLRRQQWLGLLLGFTGLIPMLLTTSSTEKMISSTFISWPELAVLIAVASHSYSWMVMRQLIRVERYAPTMINGVCMTIGGLLTLFTSFFIETPKPITDPGSFISWLLLVILISNIICHNLYGYLLKRYSATFLAFTGFLGPLFAATYGMIFLHEKITWHFGVAALCFGIGLYLFYKNELESVGIEPSN